MTEKLAKFAVDIEFKDLPKETVKIAKIILLDSLGCAIGAYDSEPGRIARRLVRDIGGREESTVLGEGKVDCANAAFANGIMMRYLDWNDLWQTYTRVLTHCSEAVIPTALALGEREHLSGEQVILATVLGYDLMMRLAETPLRKKPTYPENFRLQTWGQGTAFTAGKLLNLNKDQMMVAMALNTPTIIVGHRAARAHDRGAVTMEKTLHGGWFAKNGIISALLAKYGFTAAPAIYEGEDGFCTWVGGCDYDALYGELGKMFKINEIWIKAYSTHYSFQGALDAAISLVKENQLAPDEIKKVNVITFKNALRQAMPKHYKPETPIEVQYSLPFCMATAITAGNVTPEYTESKEKMRDPKLLELAAKVKVELDPELDKISFARGALKRPSIVEIVTYKGDKYTERRDYPKGQYPQNPMPDDQLKEKFRYLASRLLQEVQIRETIKNFDRLEKVKDFAEVMEPLGAKIK